VCVHAMYAARPEQVLTELEIINAVLSAVFKNDKRYDCEVLYIEIVACFVGS